MNPDKWKQFGARLAEMDRAELRFRARQELAKRHDAALFLLRSNFGKREPRAAAATSGNFFFGRGEVQGRLDLLRERLPEQARIIIEQAHKIVRHRFDLLGYSDLAYGMPIDWHLDLVHARRAPRKMFYRVRYLDCDEVGDSKVIWELNRHQHLVMLAKAYRLTGDIRFADEILRQWRHWRVENPYPVGINWASSLEVAFRAMAWLWTYHLLDGAPGLPNLREEWIRILALHGRHIERYLSTYFSPNTHLLGEGVGLFFLGVLCPELASAERWKSKGWQIVLDESRRQVRPDGFHFEQSTYYHVYALDLFLHAAVLASVNGIPLPAEFERVIEKMLDALYMLGRCGAPPRLGDDDGGRIFDPRRNHAEHLLDPLSTGAILFNRGDYKAVSPLTEETIWLLGPEGVRVWDELPGTPANLKSAALKESGIYMLSTEDPPAQAVVDCGPMGTQSGGHAHADALSLTLSSRKHELLIDPGTCEYAGAGDERNFFRGTAMHNTLRVDGLDQVEPATAFSWQRRAQSKTERWVQGHSFDLLVASHDGYQRLASPVAHWRWVFSLRNGMYVVRDRVEGTGRHQLEISWHLAAEMQMVQDGVFRVKGASEGLAVIAPEGDGWTQEVRRQSWSQVYGVKAPATVVAFSKRADLPEDFCTILVALAEAHERPGTLTRIGDSTNIAVVQAYQYSSVHRDFHFFFAGAGKDWRAGSVASDAEFVCWSHTANGEDEKLILVNGSRVEMGNRSVLRFTKTVEWGELTAQGNRREILSSDPAAVNEKPELTLSESRPSDGF